MLKHSLSVSSKEVSELSKLLGDERNERQLREEKFVVERDQLLRDHSIGDDSLTHSLTYLLTYLLTYSFTHSLT